MKMCHTLIAAVASLTSACLGVSHAVPSQPESEPAQVEPAQPESAPVESEPLSDAEWAELLAELERSAAVRLAEACGHNEAALAIAADVRRVYSAWLSLDGAELMQSRLELGLAFRRPMAVSRCKSAVRWSFLSDAEPNWADTATDEEVFDRTLSAQRGSGLEMINIEMDSLKVGLGVEPAIRSDEWPYTSVRGSISLFEDPAHELYDWTSVEDTEQTVHVDLKVMLASGTTLHVQLGYLLNQDGSRWVPIACSIAGDKGEWPWPWGM